MSEYHAEEALRQAGEALQALQARALDPGCSPAERNENLRQQIILKQQLAATGVEPPSDATRERPRGAVPSAIRIHNTTGGSGV